MGLEAREKNLEDWKGLSEKIKKIEKAGKELKIGIVGKYFNFKSCRDTYISVIESINHACWFNNVKPNILWLDFEEYEKKTEKLKELDNVPGIIVSGGFGRRGTEGMVMG